MIRHKQHKPKAKLVFARNHPHIFCLTLLLLLFVTNQPHAESVDQDRDPYEHFFHQSFNNLQEEAEIAMANSQKGIYIMFNDKDCPWCAKMKATILNQKRGSRLLSPVFSHNSY